MEIPEEGIFIRARSTLLADESSGPQAVRVQCALPAPVRSSEQLSVSLMSATISPDWLHKHVENLAVRVFTSAQAREPKDLVVRFENVPYTASEAEVCEMVRNKLETVFGTNNPMLKLTHRTAKIAAQFKLKPQCTAAFSDSFYKLFGLRRTLYHNEHPTRQEVISFSFKPPTGMSKWNDSYILKSNDIQSSFVYNGCSDRILDFFMIPATTSYEWYSQMPKYMPLNEVSPLYGVTVDLYNAGSNQIVTSISFDFAVTLHIVKRR